MKGNRILKSTVICFLILGFLVACKAGSQSTKAMMVDQIKATSPDEEAIYSILENIKDALTVFC